MGLRARYGRAGLHTLAGAYALNALGDAERTAFERHLARCDACAQEVRGLRETAARLGEAAAAEPPARLRERVIAEAGRTLQLGPVDRGGRIVPELTGWRRWAPQLALVAALAGLAGAGVAWAAAVGAQHRLDHAETGSTEVAAVLTARDAHMMTAPVTGGGTATVVMSHSKRMLVLTTRGLRAVPGDRSYELWLMGPAGERPAGTLPRPRRGMTAPVVASGLDGGDKVGLTVEPSAGSPRPTTPPIMLLDLPA